jgi:lysozyme
MDGRARGIDISHYDGALNWSSIAGSGINFSIAQASQGADPTQSWYTDDQFSNNWQGIKDAGIIRGAYHFIGLPLVTTPRVNWFDDIHRQIDHFLQLVGPLQLGDLPPTLDLEAGNSPARWAALIASDRDTAISIVREFINYTTAQLNGVLPILYTGSFWWSDLGNPDPVAQNMLVSAYPLWFSQYPQVHVPVAIPGPAGSTDKGEASSFEEYTSRLDGKAPLHIPVAWGGPATPSWSFWQFSEYGKMPGMLLGVVDLNVFNGTPNDLKDLCIQS